MFIRSFSSSLSKVQFICFETVVAIFSEIVFMIDLGITVFLGGTNPLEANVYMEGDHEKNFSLWSWTYIGDIIGAIPFQIFILSTVGLKYNRRQRVAAFILVTMKSTLAFRVIRLYIFAFSAVGLQFMKVAFHR